MASLLKKFWQDVAVYWLKIVCKLRYRSILENVDDLSSTNEKKGSLFIVNHTSLMDGQILGPLLWEKFRAVPLIVEEFYYNPTTHWFLKLVEAIPIPDFSAGSYDWKEKRLEEAILKVKTMLEQGRNVYLYPSGKIKISSLEDLGGNSFLKRLFERLERPSVILVRVTGLWGSSFSYGYDGQYPDFYKGWGKRLFQLLANGIFFLPKRKVHIQFSIPTNFPFEKDKKSINAFLEEWFNRPHPQGEKPTFCPTYFWKTNPLPLSIRTKNPSQVPYIHEKEQEVVDILVKEFCLKKDDLTLSTRLDKDLGLDSLDVAKLMYVIESQFDVGMVSAKSLCTIKDLVCWISHDEEIQKPVFMKKILRNSFIKPSSISPGYGDLWTFPINPIQFKKTVSDYISKLSILKGDLVGVMMLNSVNAMASLTALRSLDKTPLLIDKNLSFPLNQSMNGINILTSKQTLYILNQTKVMSFVDKFLEIEKLLPSKKSLGSKMHEEVFPFKKPLFKYLALKDGQAELEDFSFEDTTSGIEKIQSLNLPRDKPIALIHAFNKPKEVAISLILLLLDYPLLLLSSYRVSSRELAQFLQDWDVSTALCDARVFTELTQQPLENVRLLEFDALL